MTLFLLDRDSMAITEHALLSVTIDRYLVAPGTPHAPRDWFPTPLRPGGVVFAPAGDWTHAWSVDRDRLIREARERVEHEMGQMTRGARDRRVWLAGFLAEHGS